MTISYFPSFISQVLTRKANGTEEVIAVNQLPKGVYIVRIGAQAVKLVKK
jgi:hypothetical protein